MPDLLLNLLPEARRRRLRLNYFMRLGVVAAFMLSGVIVVHGIFLLPTYVLLSSEAAARTSQLAVLDRVEASPEETALEGRLATLGTSARALLALGTAPSDTAVLRAIVALPHAGIALTNFSFVPASSKGGAAVVLSGIAATRDALRNYDLALESASFVRSVDLPVGAYAKESTIPFILTLSLRTP